MTTHPARATWHPALWAVALGSLLAAGIAARTGAGMNWSTGDFVAAALLLLGGAAAFELVARLAPTRRWLAGAVVLGVVLLVWAELAVGIVS